MLDQFKDPLYRLLRWSEKYTKTDMVFTFSAGYWSLVAQAASSAAALALALIVARVVPQAEYGQYQYILSVVGFLSVFSLYGIGGAVLQSVAKGFDQSLWEGFWLNLRWSFGIVVGALAIGGYYFYHSNYYLGGTILLAGLVVPLIGSFNLYGQFLSGKKDTKRASLYPNGIGNVVPMLGIIAGALIFHSAIALVLGYIVGNMLTAIFLFFRTMRMHPLNDRRDPDLKRYSFHLSAANVLNIVANNLDNLLLFHYLGAAQVAVYNFAVSVPDQAKGPISTVGTMTLARFTGHTPKSIRASMRNKMFWLFVVIAAGIAAYFFLAPFAYAILFPTYIASVDYSRVYILSLLANVFIPAGAFLAAHKCIREQYLSNLFSSTFQIGAVFAGVLWFGIWGLVLARVVSRIATGLVIYLLYLRAQRRLAAEPLPEVSRV